MCATVWWHLVKATEVTAGLAEINGCLYRWVVGFEVTCGLTACTPGLAPCQTLRNDCMENFTFFRRPLAYNN